MREKQKKIVFTIIIFAFALLLSNGKSFKVYANSIQTEDEILNMSEEMLLNTLEANGLSLPEYYAKNREKAERFVAYYTHIFIKKEKRVDEVSFNYTQSNNLINNLVNVLRQMGFELEEESVGNSNLATRTSLQNSTVLGSWSSNYLRYNCYGYAIGKTTKYEDPGYYSGASFDLSMSIIQMANVVIEDLDSLGYNAYKTLTKPTSLPDNYHRVICIRKTLSTDPAIEDYHFMKMYNNSLSTWTHKPADTQPLRWNYSSPNATIWDNECQKGTIVYGPDREYNSSIYYIVYKGKNDPGVQITQVTDLDEY